MEGKSKSFKLAGILIAILLLPVLFFALIGDDPTKKKEKATGEIAIVNEDLGAEFNRKPINFGKEIASSIDENSNYKWVVVNRSLANRGIENQQYDAVLYIPSDFSKSVLTFTDKTPVKADVEYKIQSNLEAKNLEKVQRELERSKNKMNKQLSTLYWGFVSQQMEDVRKKFDQILEKEIAFQKSMYAFYTPSSKNLAGEIDQQRKMLEQLRESTQTAEEASASRGDELKDAAKEIKLFIDDVNRYKEYQEQQSELLRSTNETNQALLQEGVANYQTVVNAGMQSIIQRSAEAPPIFTMNPQAFMNDVALLRNQIGESRDTMAKLVRSLEESTAGEEFSKIVASQKMLINQFKQQSTVSSLNQLQSAMLPAREKLNQSNGVEQPPTSNEQPPVIGEVPELEEGETITLDILKQQAAQLKEKTVALQTEENTIALEEVTALLSDLETEIAAIEAKIAERQLAYGKWQEDVKAAVDQIKQQQQEPVQVPASTASADTIIEKIRVAENNVLASPALSQNRKQELQNSFSPTIQSKNVADLLSYYGYLSAFQEMARKAGDPESQLIDGILSNSNELDNIEEAFHQLTNETQYFRSIQNDLHASVENMEKVERDFNTLVETVTSDIENYEAFIESEQAAINEQVKQIQSQAEEITGQLQKETSVLPESEEVPSISHGEGEFVLTIQQNAVSELNQVSGLVTSLADRHGNITEYTSELQKKVGSVQEKADVLNSNWAKNVEATKKVQGDVYGILDNTMVDGQNNGYVYDHLSSPVEVKGETPEEQTVPTPPIVMLVIVLITGMLIGFVLHHYERLPLMIHLPLMILLNTAAGIIISLYGLNIYHLEDTQAIKWTMFTTLLVFAAASIVRMGLRIGPFTGWIVNAGLILFFVLPLLDLVLPNYELTHPVTAVYLSIQYGDQTAFYAAVVVLGAIITILSVIAYVWKSMSVKSDVAHEG
ncbi:MAG TPA: type VII secretion protein EsaA [Chondromyces sp.]|nr:type VII secretion protein EsaA [Chondromyces sp.]